MPIANLSQLMLNLHKVGELGAIFPNMFYYSIKSLHQPYYNTISQGL